MQFSSQEGAPSEESVAGTSWGISSEVLEEARVTFDWVEKGDQMAYTNTLDASTSVGFTGAMIHALRARGTDEVQATAAPSSDPLGSSSRLFQLLTKLEHLLSEPYAFDVFAKDTINFGVMLTYRQTWEPEQYQVGELVKTIPLAPKEMRRYTKRAVTKKTRATKELEDNLQNRKTDSSDTVRVDEEIVQKAQEKTHFNLNAKETFGGDGFSVEATQGGGGDSSKESSRTKKDMRESVLKSAQEYRQQHRMEIDTSESLETEDTTFHEIQNPNDELAVTYLFNELQRTTN